MCSGKIQIRHSRFVAKTQTQQTLNLKHINLWLKHRYLWLKHLPALKRYPHGVLYQKVGWVSSQGLFQRLPMINTKHWKENNIEKKEKEKNKGLWTLTGHTILFLN